ncbi:MAG TPA: hypothetical protein PKW56_02135 [Clostridiales bacterium]|nr:hypothetical protein [Clostridiales bacterium]
MSLNKNQTITIEAGPLNELFESVTKVEGIKLVCPGLLPGEKAEVKIIKSGKNVAFGKILKITSFDKDRVTPECRNGNCTTCELIFASYEKQLQLKKEKISKLFGSNIDIIPSPQYSYRNRAVIPVGKKDGKIIIGTYRQNSHEITGWDHSCPIMTVEMNRIVEHVKDRLGHIPHIELPEQLFIRGAGDSYQAGFIVKKPSSSIKNILKNIPGISSSFYSISAGSNSVLVKDPVFVSGTDNCVLGTDNGEYKVSPGSFFQANILILNRILEKLSRILKPGMKILDLYSGCGVLSDFPGVIRTCIESNSSSFGFLERNENTELITADAGDLSLTDKFDVIIADPPRKGIAHRTLETIDGSGSDIFIYLSCDPVTQKRDINILINYEISEITAFDMFPNTVHIESLAILKRKNI